MMCLTQEGESAKTMSVYTRKQRGGKLDEGPGAHHGNRCGGSEMLKDDTRLCLTLWLCSLQELEPLHRPARVKRKKGMMYI